MMFLWIPFLVLIALVMWRPRADGGMAGCCGGHESHTPPPASTGSAPIEIARQRLARGEITTTEFEEIRRVLG